MMVTLQKPSPRLKKAIEKAHMLHQGQKRKEYKVQLPYVAHLMGVAEMLSKYTADEDIIIAGLLHDTIEDTNYTFGELREDFGERVKCLVAGVTEDMALKKMSDKKATWKKRKSLSLEYLKKKATQEVLILSLADRTNNLKSLLDEHKKQGDKMFKKFNAPKQEQAWLFDELYRIYKEKVTGKIFKEFEDVYCEVRGDVFDKNEKK